MEKDPRYHPVKVMIETGNIAKFSQIFQLIPKSVVAGDLGLNNNRMTRLIDQPGDFSIAELVRIANLINIVPKSVIELVLNEHLSKSNSH